MKKVANKKHSPRYKPLYPAKVHIYVEIDNGADTYAEFHQECPITNSNVPMQYGQELKINLGPMRLPWKQLKKVRVPKYGQGTDSYN